MRIENGTFRASAEGSSNWNLLEGTGIRVYQGLRVNFPEPFASAPRIHLGITEFDILDDRNARLKVSVGDQDESGFSVNVKTWCDSKVWSVEVDWLAYGE